MIYINNIELQGLVKACKAYESQGRRHIWFTVCTHHSMTNAAGTHVNEVLWVVVTAWEQDMPNFDKVMLLQPGDPIHVVGRLRRRRYTKSDQTEEWITEVVPSRIDVLDPSILKMKAEMAVDDLPDDFPEE